MEQKIYPGLKFKSKNFVMTAEVLRVETEMDNNRLDVLLTWPDGKTNEEKDWNLQHTKWGFESGEYEVITAPTTLQADKEGISNANYENMPVWNKEKYASWKEWAIACFEAGRNDLKAENEALKAANKELHDAAKGVIDSWQKGTQGDIEELKTNKVGNDTYQYWSPATANVESGSISQLRKAINNNPQK